MASTGHSGSHSVQSMHSSGSMTRKFGPSWKQSTGQTSTQSVYLHLMHCSVTTKVMRGEFRRGKCGQVGPRIVRLQRLTGNLRALRARGPRRQVERVDVAGAARGAVGVEEPQALQDGGE